MKKICLQLFLLLCVYTVSFGQNVVTINQNITANTTFTSGNIYLLSGANFLYVTNDATLTIEPGTIIKGDPAALVITRGSKLIANGTKEQPIVFTSSKAAGQRGAGDWGGLLLLGKAKINAPGGEAVVEGGIDPVLGKYGGSDDADNSGSLKYVRVEFAGIAFQPNNETNGITFGAVGSGTTIENVQVSFGGDDSFEWFGGTVNGKYLFAYKTVDDMYDSDFGYTGKNQFVFGVSDPQVADVSGSNGFESDNDAQGTANIPVTDATFSNVTLLGPLKTPGTAINTNFRRGAHIRRSSQLDIINSIIAGFPTGLRLESANSENGYLTNGTLNLKNNLIAGMTRTVDSVNVKYQTILDSFSKGNSVIALSTDLKLTDPTATVPNALPATGSPALTGANFTNADAFFSKVAYRGAFGATNWTDCWCEYDPQNADYTKGLNYTAAIADFTFTVVNNVVSFVAPTGTNYTYNWNFGNFTTAATANPTVTYSALGTYTVTLTVTNGRGCTKTLSKQVSITSGSKEIGITGDITTNTTWTKDKIYRLTGSACLYVRNNAVLTIEAGTIVKGDPSALVVTRGSKIIAIGTAKQPIVFTSAKPAGQRITGDWGGLAILGAAKVNCPGGQCILEGGCDPVYSVYGGTDDNDNSGILSYVRIEYAGIAFQPNNELNSLTLGGVGKGTTINNVQCSFGGDDAFEWFGGSVDSKYLIGYKTVDDIFDTDFGYTGRNQFSLGISDPQVADVSGSNAFEADNDAQGTLNTPISGGTFSNTTVFGPKAELATSINTNFRRGAHLRRSTRQDHYNSVLTGFPTGIRLESVNSENAFLTQNELNLKGNVLAGMTRAVDSVTNNFAAIFGKLVADGNSVFPLVSDMKFTNGNINAPDLRPTTGSPLLVAGNQDVYKDTFFTKVNYIGAFGTNNWTNCWAEWDPQNADYSISPLNYATFVADFNSSNTNGVVNFTPVVNDPNLTYAWSFGDGNTANTALATNTYKANGVYDVILTITNKRGCSETKTNKVSITTSNKDIEYFTNIVLAPNPAAEFTKLNIYSNKTIDTDISVLDLSGKVLHSTKTAINTGLNEILVNTSDLISGLYLIQIRNISGINTLKLQIAK